MPINTRWEWYFQHIQHEPDGISIKICDAVSWYAKRLSLVEYIYGFIYYLQMKWNEWCLWPQFCTCKAILGRGQQSLKRSHIVNHQSVVWLVDWFWLYFTRFYVISLTLRGSLIIQDGGMMMAECIPSVHCSSIWWIMKQEILLWYAALHQIQLMAIISYNNKWMLF